MLKLKRFIRGLNSTFCFAIFGIGGFSIGSIAIPLIYVFIWNKTKRKKAFVVSVKKSWQFFVLIMKTLNLLSISISSEDKRALGELKSTIVVANHPSLIDVLIVVSHIPNPVCLVKGKLTKNFFMQSIVLNAYINNDEPAEKLIEKCQLALNSECNLVIFPEGTRTVAGEKIRLHRGASYIAIATGCTILPLQISMSDNVLGKHQKWYAVGDKCVEYTIKVQNEIVPTKVIDNSKTNALNARFITEQIKKDIAINT